MKKKSKLTVKNRDIFIIYPSKPPQISDSVHSVIKGLYSTEPSLTAECWEDNDIAGKFIIDGILEKIDNSNYIVADITRLNFNVIFEIAYAIAKGKRIIPTINCALNSDTKEISQLGILDTVGYSEYSNSKELETLIRERENSNPLRLPVLNLDKSAPLYILDTLYKTDAALRIISRVKKSRIKFRSHDPKETSRLSLSDAYKGVASSSGVIVNLLSSNNADYKLNNLRGAFIAGLAMGLEKELLILQEGDELVPLDYRDFVNIYRHPDEINAKIAEFAPRVIEKLQEYQTPISLSPRNLLEGLDLGSSAAENEASTLHEYFVQTNEYNDARSGKFRLAVGRKGSGKTALFYRLRDEIRRNKLNVVLDLKPDGYQLKRFKDIILTYLTEGVREHAAVAFWEYIFVMEICYKLIEKDREAHLRDHKIYDYYEKLVNTYGISNELDKEDFSERILRIVNQISDKFEEKYLNKEGQKLFISTSEISDIIYKHNLPEILKTLVEYLSEKKEVWLLFDNIDKGWPTHGVQKDDIVILRGILDASRKLQRYFEKVDIDFRSIIFIRNDVYENLLDLTSDRGKQSKVSLDWTDKELLQEFIRKRIVNNNEFNRHDKFEDIWPKVVCTHINGEDSSDYLISRSLMRPRNLLNLLNYSKSQAVNLGHKKITEEDIKKACSQYSADIVNDIGLEIRDVFEMAEDVIYEFIDTNYILSLADVRNIIANSIEDNSMIEKLIELLMWFSFLGIIRGDDEDVTFIYDVHYDMKKLRVIASKPDVKFYINKAFWPFLDITAP